MDPAEAAVLNQIVVRRIELEEQARWNQLVSQGRVPRKAAE